MKAIAVIAVVLGWSTAFAQKVVTLNDAIRQAQSGSPSVRSAMAEVEAARQETRMNRARLSPQLFANGFAADSKPGAMFQSAPGTMGSSAMVLPKGQTWVANLMLMVPIFTGGTLQALVGSAAAKETAARGTLAEAQREASLQAEAAYLAVQFANAQIETVDVRVRASEELVRTMRARLEAGNTIEASVQRAQAELAQALRSRTAVINERAKALLDLHAVMGTDLAESITTVGSLTAIPEPEALDTYIVRALSERGSVRRAQAEVDMARERLRAAEGTKRPQVFLQAMSNSSSEAMMRGSSVGLTVSVPIFDAGERAAETASMREMVSSANQNLRGVQLSVEKEVRQAWLDLQTARANAKSAQSSVESAQSAFEVVRLRLDAGKAILLEQLDALQSLTQAREDLSRAIFDQQLAFARLRRASATTSPRTPAEGDMPRESESSQEHQQ